MLVTPRSSEPNIRGVSPPLPSFFSSAIFREDERENLAFREGGAKAPAGLCQSTTNVRNTKPAAADSIGATGAPLMYFRAEPEGLFSRTGLGVTS